MCWLSLLRNERWLVQAYAAGIRTEAKRLGPAKTIRRTILHFAFWVWVTSVLTIGSYLLGRHILTLPSPARDAVLAERLLHERGPQGDRAWFAVHVLAADCPCSQKILRKLLTRRPVGGVSERIVLVGSADVANETAARSLGYDFEYVTSVELAERYRVEAAPIMLVLNKDGAVKYVGGYTDRKQGEAVRDYDVLSRLLRGEDVAPLPTFGCAVSRRLQSAIDPLGIR